MDSVQCSTLPSISKLFSTHFNIQAKALCFPSSSSPPTTSPFHFPPPPTLLHQSILATPCPVGESIFHLVLLDSFPHLPRDPAIAKIAPLAAPVLTDILPIDPSPFKIVHPSFVDRSRFL